jgi:hypothetical protein
MPWNKWIIVAAFACAAAGCRAPTGQLPQAPSPIAASLAPPPAVPVYRIDTERSQLRLLVYRSGPLARLGHDHVILAHGLAGWIAQPEKTAEASFYLQIPVDDFNVDDPQARAEAGPDFAEPVDDDAKAGTRHNMLSAAVLDAAQHPLIEIDGHAFAGAEPDLRVTVHVRLAGHDSTQVVPFRLRRSADGLTASAEFPLRQTDLGLTPFSVMMGALRVEDQMQAALSLVASAQ